MAQLWRVLREQNYPAWYTDALAACRDHHGWSYEAFDAATVHLFGTAMRNDLIANTSISSDEISKLDMAATMIPEITQRRWIASGLPDTDMPVIEDAFTRVGFANASDERYMVYAIYFAASGMIRFGAADFAAAQ